MAQNFGFCFFKIFFWGGESVLFSKTLFSNVRQQLVAEGEGLALPSRRDGCEGWGGQGDAAPRVRRAALPRGARNLRGLKGRQDRGSESRGTHSGVGKAATEHHQGPFGALSCLSPLLVSKK